MKSRHHSRPQRALESGFSLVELSIVLVILGLLTGGILTGQNLIRAAELRSVVTEFQAYQTAVMTFRDQYFALPGDMRNATDFWGAATSCPGTASTDASTCNGDGNGIISVSTASSYESFRAWQHLANAGLVPGSYSGVGGALNATKDAIPGKNVPVGKMSNTGWFIERFWNINGAYSANWFAYDLRMLIFGARLPGYETNAGALHINEAWNLDAKIDDGMPGKGKVLSLVSCTDGDNNFSYDSKYQLSDSSTKCSVVFQNFF